MKKIIALIMTALLLLSLGACGKGSVNDEVDTTKEFALGTKEGNTYVSDFIGIGFNKPEDWYFYTDKQMREINSIADDVTGEEYTSLLKDAKVAFDMYATRETQSANININLEKADLETIKKLDLKKNYKSAREEIKTTYESIGYRNLKWDVENVVVDSKTIPAMTITAEMSGIKMYQTTFSVKCNGYLANVSITTFTEDTRQSVLDCLFWC